MRKLAMVAGSFSAAIFAANYIIPVESISPIAVLAVAAGLICLVVCRRKAKIIPWMILFLSLGLFWFHFHNQNTVAQVQQYAGKTRNVSVKILNYPEVYDDYCRLEVKIDSRFLPNLKAVMYDNDKQLCNAKPGDRLSVRVKIDTADTIFGEKYDNYHSKGIYFKLSTRGEARLERNFDIFFLPQYIEHWLSGRISRIFPADTEVFMRSLLLGDKSDFYDDEQLYVALSRAGLMHIVAVSGMHISFLVGLLHGVLGKGRRSALICIALVWLFAFVTGAGPSVVRAAFMHSYFLMAPILRRENDSLTSLSVILAVLLGINPFAAASISLQLSFGAMCGIVLFADKIGDSILKRIPFAEKTPVLRGLVASISCSLSVMVFTVPLTALHFGNVQLLSPITNLISLWAVSICFCWGWISCALSVIPYLGLISAVLCSWLARYILLAAKLISSIPFSVLYMNTIWAWIWLLVSMVLVALAFAVKRHRFKASLAALVVSGLFAAGAMHLSSVYYRKHDTINILDVGQGQCISVLSGDSAIILDCGNINELENAGVIAAAHLYSKGRDSVDILVLSHLHEDHAAGALMLMEMIDVKTIILPYEYDDENGIFHEIKEAALRNGTELVFVKEGRQINSGDIELELIKSGFAESENERCLITKIECDGIEMLAMADASAKMEKELVKSHELKDVDILVVSHHGSRYSSSEELLEAVGGNVALISVGYNYYGHPAEETLEALETYGYNVYRTDIAGDIEIRIGNNYGKKSW